MEISRLTLLQQNADVKTKIETTSICFFDCRRIVHRHFVLPGQTVNLKFVVQAEESLRQWVRHLSPKVKSESESHCDWQSWCRAPFGAHDQILVTVWQLLSCYCGAPSLTRGRVCLLSVIVCSSTPVVITYSMDCASRLMYLHHSSLCQEGFGEKMNCRWWRWCITHRITGFSDFVHRPDSK
jgi:hypothetical protein